MIYNIYCYIIKLLNYLSKFFNKKCEPVFNQNGLTELEEKLLGKDEYNYNATITIDEYKNKYNTPPTKEECIDNYYNFNLFEEHV